MVTNSVTGDSGISNEIEEESEITVILTYNSLIK
jgi:hypothetical protein